MKISTWDEARDLGLKEAEKRLGISIEKYWIDSIRLEPRNKGGYWTVRLDLQVRKSLGRKNLIHVSMKINPSTGEITDFHAEER
ncbi:MAG TPA: hypothetical protein ENG21_00595 [Nitrososphaeria archaeon]|nr:MAG: hypothetical protein DRN47_00565 [Candidatus Wolframiiraptor sp.]HDD39736.1 hypothetical protein [Nitrososphaeria archaeon]